MARILDIQAYMHTMASNHNSPEEIFGRAVHDLYIIKNDFSRRGNHALRNRTHASIACLKLLYDYGQQMCLARTYLIHRLRVFDAREQDMDAELSVLRGITPNGEDETTIDKTERCNLPKDVRPCEDDSELDIIMDTRMIKEIDLSEAALRDISRRIEEKKNTLSDIEQQMNDVSNLLTSSGEYLEPSQQGKEPIETLGSLGFEWTQGLVSPNHPRDGDTRILSPNDKHMDIDMDLEINLQPQRSRSLSGRRISPTVPGAGMSSSYVGPALSLPTGEERKLATVEVMTEDNNSNKLIMGSLITTHKEPETENQPFREEELKTPSSKRKARNSPGAPSPSNKKVGKISPVIGESEKTIIRKRKVRTKKICRNAEQTMYPLLHSSLTESLDELEESRTGETPEEKGDKVVTARKLKRTTRSSGKEKERIQVISSDDEDSAALISSANSVKATQGRRSKEQNKNVTIRKDSLGEESSIDLTVTSKGLHDSFLSRIWCTHARFLRSLTYN